MNLFKPNESKAGVVHLHLKANKDDNLVGVIAIECEAAIENLSVFVGQWYLD